MTVESEQEVLYAREEKDTSLNGGPGLINSNHRALETLSYLFGKKKTSCRSLYILYREHSPIQIGPYIRLAIDL